MSSLLFKFRPGSVCATPGVAEKIKGGNGTYFITCLRKHLAGDWGLMSPEDCHANEQALRTGARLMSAYPLPNDPNTFWIITEADRSVTTLLLPDEY